MWLPVHGCALPLPKRSVQCLGIRQHGPKPSALHRKCSTDRQLAWILLVGGAEAIVEFSLARCELTRCPEEERHWLRFCKLAVRLQNKQDQVAAELEEAKPPTWEQRRQLLIEREQQRRYGDAHQGLERSWTKPSTQRIDHQQPVRTR